MSIISGFKKIFSPIELERVGETVAKQMGASILGQFKVEGNEKVLEVEGVEISPIKEYDFLEQQKIKDEKMTWGDKIKATFVLKNKKTGEVIDRKTIKSIQIPKATDRGSFIVDGNEYQVHHQLRLDPGVYTYRDNSGDIQTQFNLEKGSNFKLNIDPNTSKFKIRMATANYDAYPIFKASGVSDDDMKKAWGFDLWKKNVEKHSPDDLYKFHSKLFKKNYEKTSSDKNFESVSQDLKKYFESTKMSDKTNALTIGIGESKITPKVLIQASKKYLDVAAGREKQDERDDLTFQTLHTAEDHIKYRIEKSLPEIVRKIKYKIDKKDSIGSLVSGETFTNPVKSFFVNSQLSAPSEQINALHSIANASKITRMGEGGISSMEMVTDKARSVHPSQFGFMDPYETVEGSQVGITTSLALGAQKREDGRLVAELHDVRSGKKVFLTPLNIKRSIVSFADQYDSFFRPLSKMVKAIHNHQPIEVDSKRVQYIFPHSFSTYGTVSSIIPFQNSNQGNRTMMAAKQIPQHNMLKEREVPLVQVRSGFGKEPSFEYLMGKAMAIFSPGDGVVEKITPSHIIIKVGTEIKKIPYYSNFTLNQGSFLNHDILVKAGDRVKKDQLLADLNNTKDGIMATGKNLHVGYMPFKGYNYEDGVVISETASKKLTSLHMHRFEDTLSSDDFSDKKRFIAFFPTSFTPKQLENIGEDGVVRNGTILNYGDPIILIGKRKSVKTEDLTLGSVSKKLERPFTDRSHVWEYNFPGQVIRAISGKNPRVNVKSEEKANVGDKVSGRHGNKGIISLILPDEEMPATKDGRPLEIILNPQGVVGRINPSQILETLVGKAAEKRGKPIKIQNFHPQNQNHKYVENILKKYNLKEVEEVVDQKSGQSYGEITTGFQNILKLDHPVRKKITARSVGPSYSQENQPTKGEEGAQSIGSLEIYALLSHGAKENLREISTIKSDKNDDFWNKFQAGLPYSLPNQTPFVTKKMLDYMKVLGFEMQRNGRDLKPVIFSGDDVKKFSSGEIVNGRLLRSKEDSFATESGGLFDPKIFGGNGLDGTKWGHIKLKEKIPNPLFEEAILAVGGITKPEFEGLMLGSKKLLSSGKVVDITDNGAGVGEKTASQELTGVRAIESLLKKIDPKEEYEKLKIEANNTKSVTKKDQLFRKMKYLRGLNRLGKNTDAYFLDTIPVLPPRLRGVIPLDDGNLVISDANYGYRDVIGVNKALDEDEKLGLGEKNSLVSDLYKATKALQGFGDPISKGKDFKGVMEVIKGARNKVGYFQGKVVKRRQEVSARSTITPDPNLGLDEVALPEDIAWKIFEPHTRRQMSLSYSGLEAQKMIDNRHPAARKALENVMDERLVFVNRSPTLHRGSVLALKPRMHSGDSIKIPNLITGPLNADFDGDCFDGMIYIFQCIDNSVEKRYNESKKGSIIPFDLNTRKFKRIHISEFPHTGKEIKKTDHVEEYSVEGIEVLSYCQETYAWKVVPVESFSIHKNLEKIEVRFQSGRKVLCSDDASLFTIPKGFLQPERMKPFDAVECLSPCPNLTKVETSVTEVNIASYNTSGKRRGHQLKNSVLPLNYEFGWYIGAMCGDGWTNINGNNDGQKSKVMIAKVSKPFQQRVFDFVSSVVEGVQFTITENPHLFQNHESYSEKITYSCEDMAYFINEIIGCGAYNKKLPDFFLQAPEEFRFGLLAGLYDSDGSMSWTSEANKRAKPQFSNNFNTKSEHLKDDFCMLCWSLGMRTTITEYRGGYTISIRTHDLKKNHDKIKLCQENKRMALERLSETELREDISDYVPLCDFIATSIADEYRKTKNNSRYTSWRSFSKKLRVPRTTAQKAIEDFPFLFAEGMYLDFKRIVDSGIVFDVVKEVTRLPGKHTLWDLTIPGSFTFLSADGSALFDTMSVHVPVTIQANEEAKKMLPSSLLLSPLNKGLYFTPSQEMILGLYQMTRQDGKETNLQFKSLDEALSQKTKIGEYKNKIKINGINAPFGSHIVNSVLPNEIRDYKNSFSKKVVVTKLDYIAKNMPEKYGQIINFLKDWGNKASTGESNTVRLSDFTSFEKERDQILNGVESLVSEAERSSKNENEKMEKKVAIYEKAMEDFQNRQKKFFSENPKNNLGNMFNSGSRGTAVQIMQTLAAPMLVRDFEGKPLPFPIKKNYIEGQSIIEDLFSAQSARHGTVQKVKGVAEPGAFAKSLVAANMQNVITEVDCGTKDGIFVDPEDSLGRFLASDIAGVGKRNEAVTETILNRLKRSGEKVFIRSQTKCKSPRGVCSMCYGLNEKMKMMEVGENPGVADAQSLAEPLTQAAMKVFHMGGLAETKKKQIIGYDRIKQLYAVPENLPDRGLISEENGRVEKIEKSPAGGYDITINGKTFYSHSEDLMVKNGDQVTIGQPLSKGYYRPQDMIATVGKEKTQEYMIEELRKAFKDSGVQGDRRVYESIVNRQTSMAKITESDDEDFLVGDVTKVSRIEDAISKGSKIKYKNLVRPIDRLPLDDTNESNIFQSLNFRELQRAIKKNVALGEKTEVEDTTNPIGSYVMGNFGKTRSGEKSKFY